MVERYRSRAKVCGVTTVADAVFALDCGVQLIGLNFVPSSPRCLPVQVARTIVDAIGARAEVVGVVADLSVPDMQQLRQVTRIDSLQLHGDEPPAVFEYLSANDYKAVRVATASDVARARQYPGERLLVDAKVEGILGGSGHVFDWDLVVQLAAERQLLLAGGLNPHNVALAIARVRPWAVDVASGVESAPGTKDESKVQAFVDAVNSAAATGLVVTS